MTGGTVLDLIHSLLLQTAPVPVIVSAVIAAGLVRSQRTAPVGSSVALAAAFFAGWVSQDWTTLQPTRYLDWLPWVTIGLSTVVLANASGLSARYVWCLVIAACIGAAWLLVPSFPRLQPPRPQAVAMLSVAAVVLTIALERLAARISHRLFIAGLMATGTAGSIVLAQSFSLKFAQIMGILTAALTGSLLFGKHKSEKLSVDTALVFMTVFTNLMFIGCAGSTSDVPVFCYAILPAAPITLWITVCRQGGDTMSTRALLSAIAVLFIVLLIAVVPAILAHPPWEAES